MNTEEEIKLIKEMAQRNYELISANTKNINDNLERINKNKYALDILKDYKKEARKWRIAFFITLALLIVICIHHFIIK